MAINRSISNINVDDSTDNGKVPVFNSTTKVFDMTTPSGGGVTTMAAIGATPNANGATISGSTLNLQPADASFGGVVTTGTQTLAGAKTFSSSATFNAGVSVLGGGTFSTAASGMQLVGSSTLFYNAGISTSTPATLTTGVSSARFIVGTAAVGTFTSGTHPIIASTAFKPQTITNNGATVTNTATAYIEGTMSGGTNNYALWVDAGEVRVDGDIGDTTNRAAKVWATNAEFTNAPTVGGVAMPTSSYFTLVVGRGSTLSWNDATVYYFSTNIQTNVTTSGINRIYLPFACKLVAATVYGYANTLGTSEAIDIKIRVNNTTDTTITSTFTLDAKHNSQSITGLNASVGAGDYFEIVVTAPTWSTQPQTAQCFVNLFFKSD